jgi:hypothetical protein
VAVAIDGCGEELLRQNILKLEEKDTEVDDFV